MATLSDESLYYIINHVILPPKLPRKAESQSISRRAEQDLLRLVLEQVKVYDVKSSLVTREQWRIISSMLTQWIALDSTEKLSSKTLAEVLAVMQTKGEF